MFFAVYCLCIFFAGVVGSNSKQQFNDLHHRMKDRDIEKTFGVDSREKVPEYEVISPYMTDESGDWIDYSLHGQSRTRRSTNGANFWYFKVNAFGRLIHLNLTKVNPYVTSGALVQTVHKNGSSTYKEIPRSVYYTGHVMSDPESLVAITGKNGLEGMIRTLHDTFYIKPLPSHVIKENEFNDGQAHVIYRRSIEDVSSECHFSENTVNPIKRARPSHHRRRKRQVPHKFLELALVADNFAISAYGEDEMRFHLLTVAHIATQLYHDSSIGPIKITPVIVRLVLKKDGFGYDSSSSRGDRIKALERWAKEHFPHSDKEPDHADAVVLITKKSSGGIASLGSTCRSTFGAALSNDIGLGSAIIVTHELAHTMGVSHDGSSSSCVNHKNIMASTIPSGPGSMKWSACSREKFQDFLSHKSDCLDDIPSMSDVIQEPKEFYGKLAGQVINRDEQCKMIFGKRFYACPQRLTSCHALGCTDDGYKCLYSSTSPADGTRCGNRHWCINGQCVDDGSRVINGRWSNWSAFSKCTRPCGGGVQSKTRTCTNPVPKNGGMNCIGPAEGHWRICNPEPCPAGSKSFRQLQCEEINPDFSAFYNSDKCLLTCRKGSKAYPQGQAVKDGTRCIRDPTSRDVCIKGRCRHVACDNRLVSRLKRDRCGVCGGDSSKCRFVQSKWNDRCPGFGPEKACPIFEVPVGSTSVYVEQDTPDKNLLGIKDKEGKYVIPIPTWSKTVYAAGTKVHYYHEKEIDINKVFIPGPTTEKLTIVFVPGYPKTGVWYELYNSTLTSNVGVDDVQWNVTAWGKCSRKCARGKQRRIVECTRIDDGSHVGYKLCLQKSRKPAVERLCNTQPCQPEWYTSEWSSCSRTCGKGEQKRQIHCRRRVSQSKYEIVSDSSCSGNKPAGETQRGCNEIICHAEWKATSWSRCSSTCGGGLKKRSLVCKRFNDKGELVEAPEILCHYATKPPTAMDCNTEVACPTPVQLLRYRGLGCFNDGKPHSIPEYVKSFRSNIDWFNIKKTITRCAEFVHKNYPQNKVFGIKFYGECWTGNEAEETYNAYGPSSNCWNNVGKDHTYYVYELY